MQVGGVHVPWLESLMESRVQRDAAHTDIKACATKECDL